MPRQRLEEQDVDRELGQEAWRELRRLQNWLDKQVADDRPNIAIEFRSAPSIIIRSECELLGISYPRFAFRAYLSEDGEGSFVNARRLRLLGQAAPPWSGAPADPAAIGVEPDGEYMREVSVERLLAPGENTCVADSLLVPPRWLVDPDTPEAQREYRVLTTGLHEAYGEKCGNGAVCRATPFVKHMRLGGGLCAQAVCFMVTSLLHDMAKGVFGVSEITALTQPSNSPVLALGGMPPKAMVNYFRHNKVGLGATAQTTTAAHGVAGELAAPTADSAREHRVRALALAMRSYVLSGLPVALMIDAARMKGHGVPRPRCILATNRLPVPVDAGEENGEPRYHCVAVVGCSRTDRSRFVFQDPGQMPFMVATASQLIDASLPGPSAPVDAKVKDAEFIAVTPPTVQLPLLTLSREKAATRGLLDLAMSLEGEAGLGPTPLSTGPYDPGEFRLVRLGGAEGVAGLDNADLSLLEEGLRKRIREAYVGHAEAWSWLQYRTIRYRQDGQQYEEIHVRLWNASEKGPPWNRIDLPGAAPLRDQFLLRSFCSKDGGANWTTLFSPEPATQPAASGDVAATEPSTPAVRWPLRVAVVSSFTTGSVSTVGPCLRNGSTPRACELYAFMQQEVKRLVESFGLGCPSRFGSALDFMSEFADDVGLVTKFAQDIRSELGQVPVIAIATFLPELAQPVNPRSSGMADPASKAMRAIRFLGRFVLALQAEGDSVETVELVSGSLMRGIWSALPRENLPVTPTGPEELKKSIVRLKACGQRLIYANRAGDDDAREHLLNNLQTALTRLQVDAPRSATIRWALELEPGPLFVLRTWKTLCDLCRDLDARGMHTVGLNLDIAHWQVASHQSDPPDDGDMSPQLVDTFPHIQRRIFHAHLAGHHQAGHFGGFPLHWARNIPDVQRWIRYLQKWWLARSGTASSNCLSIELEAVRDLDWVEPGALLAETLLRPPLQ